MWKSQGALVDYCYFGVIFLSLQKNHKFFVVVVLLLMMMILCCLSTG
jgi:hypothetical protein